MAAVKTVLIVGGGVGGLTAGVALRRAGIDVDLVEINPNFKVYGVGIIQPNNTLRALDRVGLAQKCVELGTPFPGWKIFGANDNFLMQAPNTSRAGLSTQQWHHASESAENPERSRDRTGSERKARHQARRSAGLLRRR